jgi:hypothetical protein
MKVISEVIHEMGHVLFVIGFGGEILSINISVEWPLALSHTVWKLVDSTKTQLALIAIAGILFDTLTTMTGQFLLTHRQKEGMIYTLSLFWLSFWSYLNSVVYLVMGAFHPFGDILDLINAIHTPRLWIGSLGLILLIVYTYSLSMILKDIFFRLLVLEHSSEMVSIFWALMHAFFVSITVVLYGLPTPPVIAGSMLVLIFVWSYISGRWLMVIISQLRGVGEGFEFTGMMGSRIGDQTEDEGRRSRKVKIGYVALVCVAILSALVTGLMVNQYVSAYNLIMKTEIDVEATHFELNLEEPVLNLSMTVYNPTNNNLTLKRIEFDVKLNGKYMTHEKLKTIPMALPKDGVYFSRTLVLPSERSFTVEEALRDGEWEWTFQGTGYVDTMFGETLLRFKCGSTVEPR